MQPRSQSCHGVTFECRSPRPIFPSAASDCGEPAGGRWLPWTRGGSLKVHPLRQAIQRSLSRPSSHFCDMTDDDDDEEEQEDDIERRKGPQGERALPPPLADKLSRSGRGNERREESRLSVILIDQGLFTVYKCLFAVCFALNIVALVLAASGHFPYAKARPALFCMGNILALTLCRSEAFLRIVFWLAVELLGTRHVPLFMKTAATSFLQSVGGIHSSCGVSSVAWLIYSLCGHNNANASPREITAVSSTILSLLCFSCLAAFPLVRHLHHNVFERTHRFAGWTALALLWLFVVLSVGYDSSTDSYRNLEGSRLVKQKEFWIAVAITFFTVLPWITVRRVPVDVTSSPSGHASIIKFSGGVEPGILGRISRSPLSEWHAFGIISDGKDDHMMLAGAVGDFTKGLVSNPPSHLWVRRVRFAGLPYLVNMYRRAVLVATGSGICVFLSFLLQKGGADVCVVWVTKGVEQNFGSEIKEMMSGHPTNKVIVHDTAVHGRPNVGEMTIEAVKNWKAEVVVVTSNPKGSKDVVEACKAVGIPAFGPIWDS